MGSKKTLPTFNPFDTIAVSSTTTYTSSSTFVANLDNIGCQVSFVGTMAGTLTVEVSNDDSDYDALTFDPVLTQPAGSATKYVINLQQLGFPYVRFKYVNASGSGTLFLSIFGKDLN